MNAIDMNAIDTENVIYAVGKCRGKRLTAAIKKSLVFHESATVIAKSVNAVYRVHNAIQRVSNELGRKLSALPHESVLDGKTVLVIKITFDGGDAGVNKTY